MMQRSKQQARERKPQPALEDNLEMDALRRGAISAFLFFNLLAIACVSIPFPALSGAKDLFMPYMRWSGLFQSWDMFAPDPQSLISHLKAVVITRDRHIKVWVFPRQEDMSYWQRFRHERDRKFAEILPQPQFGPLWPDVASHVAGFFNDAADPPEKVFLIQFGSPIQPGVSQEATPKPNVFYDDYLQPGKTR
jgi:hypothetical protein